MILDNTLAAGWLVAGLVLTFVSAVGRVIWKDSNRQDD